MMFHTQSTIKEIREYFGENVFPYLLFDRSGNGAGNFKREGSTLLDIQRKNPTWNAADMVYGLNRLKTVCDSGKTILYSIYDEEEIRKDREKEMVKLIHFPVEGGSRFMLLAAGGGYGAVCSMVEAFPVAARLNEMGIQVFCLNYRVGIKPLLPKPMEDLARAYRYISDHADKFGVNPKDYGVGGFSAGGHLAASWGTENLGFSRYGFPKPQILLLAYPLICVWETISLLSLPLRLLMLRSYLGKHYSKENCAPYDIDKNVGKDYPPVYMIQAEDDATVPLWNSKKMAEVLQKEGIPFQYEYPSSGGHGFGLGDNTQGAGWVERAVAFWEELPSGPLPRNMDLS